MHELYLAECILKSARGALPAGREPESIERLFVRVGKLDAVVPESLVFLFNAIRSEHRMPDAVLEITEEEVHCECRGCENEFVLKNSVFVCPRCGSGNVRISKGRGLWLERMVIRDEVSCGNPCSS